MPPVLPVMITFEAEPQLSMVSRVYDVLVEECGANEHPDIRRAFMATWPECGEYRFQGSLGFGGKVWAATRRRVPYVSCYPENLTPERNDAICRANMRLEELWRRR